MASEIQRRYFPFDDGLAEKQAVFLLTAHPILAALTALDGTGEEVNEDEAPDPHVIQGMLEDALVLLGNANAHLNSLRQRQFAEFLTPIGKRTLKEEIPTDKHLFPDQLHERIKSKHNHSTTNNNLICKPPDQQHFSGSRSTFQNPFIPVPTMQHSQVGVKASGITIPKLTMPVQPDPPSVVSPKTPAKRADYAFPQLVPLHPLPHSTIACCRCKEFTTGSASLRIPGSWSQSKDTRFPLFGNLSMAITCDKSPLSSGRTVDAWCNQGLARVLSPY